MNKPHPDPMNPAGNLDAAVSHADDASALDALRLLQERPELSQRELSRQLGLSLGKTHYLLHALLDKGLLKVKNFRQADNKMAYAYLLTPKGIRAKVALTRSFLARKEAEFEQLQATIARLRQEVQHDHTPHTGPDH
ncbi:MarR family EPS-associated transcriptional regulator [Piscinibacter terrae]|nr:MarR family EPS-associated transcriptional regulator [Albitalea terrae]